MWCCKEFGKSKRFLNTIGNEFENQTYPEPEVVSGGRLYHNLGSGHKARHTLCHVCNDHASPKNPPEHRCLG